MKITPISNPAKKARFSCLFFNSLILWAFIPSLPAQEAPEGYRKVFASDFSNTKITPQYEGGSEGQWFYLLSGIENGLDWNCTKELNGGKGIGFALQTLVRDSKVNPMEYQEAAIISEDDNKFLRLINHKRDGNSKSRVQLMTGFNKAEKPIKGLFSRISFRIGSNMKSKLQKTWLDMIEVHDIGGGNKSALFRQGLYIQTDKEQGKSVYRLQLRNETKKKVVYREQLSEYNGWDRWETVGFQFESVGADKPAVVRVWANGKLLIEKNDIFAGYPIQNFHPFKNYINNTIQEAQNLTIDVDNWEFYTKD